MSSEKSINFAPSAARRRLLLGGAALFGTMTCTPVYTFAAPPAADPQLARFMRLSNLLINHQLDVRVGARILATAAQERPDLQALSDSIIAIAEAKQATAVEDFFEDIPKGPAQDLAYWIIFAWYTGVSSAKRDAKLFTFEQALTYKTTADVVAIPSYGFTGPNMWRQVTVPLSPMPRF